MKPDEYYDKKYPEYTPYNPKKLIEREIPAEPRPKRRFRGGVDSVIEMAVEEMGARLRDEPGTLPAHVLVKFVAEANRAADRKQMEKQQKDKEVERDVFERIDALPPAHARKLVEAEIKRVEAELNKLKTFAKTMEGVSNAVPDLGEVGTGDRLG